MIESLGGYMKDANYNKIINAEICPYCGEIPDYVDSKVIYHGKSYGMMYYCLNCDAYVGVHKGTNKPLGRLANKELREYKKLAHYYFDKISKTDLINKIYDSVYPEKSNRNKAYYWLAKQMGIDKEFCHIGMFDIDQCSMVVEICKNALKSISDPPEESK